MLEKILLHCLKFLYQCLILVYLALLYIKMLLLWFLYTEFQNANDHMWLQVTNVGLQLRLWNSWL